MDELTRLNRLIRQFQTVCHSTPDPEQRARVEGEIRDLQSYRERILAESPKGPGPRRDAREAERADFPLLSRLEGVRASHGCPFQETIHQLSLYTRYFAQQYLPLFAARQSGLDPRFSGRGEALGVSFHHLDEKVTEFLRGCQRMAGDGMGVEAEGETRRHHVALARLIETDAAGFFRSLERFCDTLGGEDGGSPRPLGETIAELEDFSSEAVAFLDVPETSAQENRRADRH
jgi:hypothetical protein